MTPAPENLDELRRQVAECDRLILATLARRLGLAEDAVRFKRSTAEISDPQLQQDALERVASWGAGSGVPPDLVRTIYGAIFRHVITRQLERFGRPEDHRATAPALAILPPSNSQPP